jgi:hypothetical protein
MKNANRQTDIKPMPDEELQNFNTRLRPDQIEKIRAFSLYRGHAIQDMAIKAIDDFFENRPEETRKAVEWYRSRGKSL